MDAESILTLVTLFWCTSGVLNWLFFVYEREEIIKHVGLMSVPIFILIGPLHNVSEIVSFILKRK